MRGKCTAKCVLQGMGRGFACLLGGLAMLGLLLSSSAAVHVAELGIFADGRGEWQNVYESVKRTPDDHQGVKPLWDNEIGGREKNEDDNSGYGYLNALWRVFVNDKANKGTEP